MEPLPAFELQCVLASDATDRCAREMLVENSEADLPSSGTHGHESAVDLGPKPEPGACSKGFQLPFRVVAAPGILEKPVGDGASDFGLCGHWVWSSDR